MPISLMLKIDVILYFRVQFAYSVLRVGFSRLILERMKMSFAHSFSIIPREFENIN